ncbi:MAG: organomercurial lyase, partial [Gammaproteobacteria bacterium]|nr:organomercurial lyase [Gammaproteobacteria bacterium]
MNAQVTTALKRLDNILPLAAGLKLLSNEDAALYCKLINSYVQQGRTLTRNEVAALVSNADQALANIVDSKLIVLDADGNPVGAYPFTSEQREHRVHVNGITTYCMCALDALSVSCMFAVPTLIDSECRVTKTPVHLEQNGSSFSAGTVDAWFGINWGAASTDSVCAASLCMEMMFLANQNVAKNWLAAS